LEVAINIAGREIAFDCPSSLVKLRLETFWTKEPATLRWIDGFRHGAGAFWDVGANIGLYAIYAAVVKGCTVLAFEPQPENYAMLCRNILRNELQQWVWPFPLALTDHAGLGAVLAEHWVAGASGLQYDETALSGLRGLGYTIDAGVFGHSLPAPMHLKIDVDGRELQVLRGGQRVLNYGMIESLVVESEHVYPTRDRIIELLDCAGYSMTGEHTSPMVPDGPIANLHFGRKRLNQAAA
jgi:FkbM family methyltransferase